MDEIAIIGEKQRHSNIDTRRPERLIGRDTFGPAVGWLAGLALAAWPGHVYMSWRIMSETLFTLLIALSVYAARPLLAAATRGAAGGGASTEADAGTDATPSGAVHRPVRLALVLGLALGAATLVKSNLLAFPALVIGCLLAGELLAKPRPPAPARDLPDTRAWPDTRDLLATHEPAAARAVPAVIPSRS